MKTILVPPYEINGSVIPVTGTRPVMAITFTTTPAKNQQKTPTTIRRSSSALVYSATFSIRRSIATKTTRIKNKPMKPNVSPRMAKTESLIDSGK